MEGVDNRLVPFWAEGAVSKHSPEVYPNWFFKSGKSDWQKWQAGIEADGWWSTLDPFPAGIAELWKEWVSQGWSEYQSNPNLLEQLFLRLEQTFGSDILRFRLWKLGDPPSPIPLRFSSAGFLAAWGGAVVRAERWNALSVEQASVPTGFVRESKRIKPLPPISHMDYWLAEVRFSEFSLLAVLEALSRVKLNYRDTIQAWVRAQEVEWYLPVSAIRLPSDWPVLPTVLAMANRDGMFCRAFRKNQEERTLR